MKPSCPRLFEAEALRDGRLSRAERTSFERHLEACSGCAAEAKALSALAERLKAANASAADELRARRERTRLLAAFDAQRVHSERAPGVRRWAFAFGAAALLVATVLLVRARARPPMASFATATVHADITTTWSRRVEGSVEKILLQRGALSIQVEPSPGRRRLLVVLPDGELEDIGTHFTVSADAGRTTRVSVQSGSVVLRLNGQPPVALGAGETWSPAPPPSATACASCEPASEHSAPPPARAPATATQPAAPRLSLPASPGSSALAAPPSHAAAPSAPQADPALDFRAAASALDSGDNATAAVRFAAFLNAHPHDARAEDAAYLRVIALQRTGNAAATRAAAAAYVSRYPRAFRRTEIEALAK